MLINIQFLRFVAATLVVVYHASFHVLDANADQGFFFATGEALGFAGVDIFFLISGFIMFYTTEQSQGAAASVEFLKRRAARIYSGYWPYFLLAAAVFAWARPGYFSGVHLIGSFFLWPMPLPWLLLDVSWTLIYEMYFYLLFTLLVLVNARLRWWLLLATFGLVGAYNLYRHLVLQDFSTEQLVHQGFAGLFLTSPFLLQFFAGACLATLPRRLHRRWGWPLLVTGTVGFLAAGLVNELVYQGGIEQGYHVVSRVALFGIPSAMILVGLVRLENSGVVAPRRFSLNTGGASYAIYLSHTIFLVATRKLGLNTALGDYPDWVVQWAFGLYCALIVLFSVGWYRWAERPLHRLFKRALRVKRSAAAKPASAG